MVRLISKLVFTITGWKVTGGVPPGIDQAVLIAAPHTSNWDLLYARCAFFIMGFPLRYTIKKEIMFFPLGYLLRALGAISIDRTPKAGFTKRKSMVEAMTDLFKTNKQLVIMITPEGTRSYAKRWKTGFYRIAEGADVPIILGYLDYKNKHAGLGPVVIATGNMEEDIEKIKEFYRPIQGKYPEKGVK